MQFFRASFAVLRRSPCSGPPGGWSTRLRPRAELQRPRLDPVRCDEIEAALRLFREHAPGDYYFSHASLVEPTAAEAAARKCED